MDDKKAIATWKLDLDKILQVFNARSVVPVGTSAKRSLSGSRHVGDSGSSIHEGDNAEGAGDDQLQEFRRRFSDIDDQSAVRASSYELPPPAYGAIDFSLPRSPVHDGEGYGVRCGMDEMRERELAIALSQHTARRSRQPTPSRQVSASPPRSPHQAIRSRSTVPRLQPLSTAGKNVGPRYPRTKFECLNTHRRPASSTFVGLPVPNKI
jgi:hypothetical protein